MSRRVPDPFRTDWHIGRSFSTHDLEDACPCPQERCGLIAQSKIHPDCPQHSFGAAKTIRQSHDPRYCPCRPALVRLAVAVQDAVEARIPRRAPSSWQFDWGHPRASLGMALGYGPHADGQAQWEIAGRARWIGSYYLGLGSWFRDGKDECHRCGCQPSDVDFLMRRVAPGIAECIESLDCHLSQEEER